SRRARHDRTCPAPTRPAGPSGTPAGSAAAAGVDLRWSVRALPRRHRRHAAARDRAGGRCRPRRPADRDLPACVADPRGRGRHSPVPGADPALMASRPEPSLADVGHLGAYAPLIAAIRDELEHFVASQVRLHLAIADRDRFRLTAIAVGCAEAPEPRRLLLQFMREFKPEQVKRYLAREVIGGLPNAAAIDLTQFAGLVD